MYYDRRAKPHPIRATSHFLHVPDVVQELDATCGAACVLSVSRYFGVGPGRELCVACDMEMDVNEGSDPPDLKRAMKKYGLTYEEYPSDMKTDELRKSIDDKCPVIMMLQAWGGSIRDYRRFWIHGHWIVAIGYDDDGFYFEDPVIETHRGYLTNEELDRRWHDYGVDKVKTKRYGLAVHPRRVHHTDVAASYQFIK